MKIKKYFVYFFKKNTKQKYGFKYNFRIKNYLINGNKLSKYLDQTKIYIKKD
jgi:hypothetical protein